MVLMGESDGVILFSIFFGTSSSDMGYLYPLLFLCSSVGVFSQYVTSKTRPRPGPPRPGKGGPPERYDAYDSYMGDSYSMDSSYSRPSSRPSYSKPSYSKPIYEKPSYEKTSYSYRKFIVIMV